MKKVIHKHAKHRARLHIETGNTEKAAEALGDLPPPVALEYLFNLATAYRNVNKIEQLQAVLDTATRIDRSKTIA